MRYRAPFTREQRRVAAREYRLFRDHLRVLQRRFAPRTEGEAEVLRRYRAHVQAIRSQLARDDRQVDANKLNTEFELSKAAVAEYFRVRHFG